MDAARAADRARFSKVEDEIQSLETHLTALRTEKEQIRRRLDEYAYPVLTLPNEITTEIFVHYLPLYPDHPPLVGLGSPTHLLGICRLWRNIALHSPMLWRSIKTGLHLQTNRHLEVVEAWLRRSGGSLLSLHFNFETITASEIQSLLLQTVIVHRSRWQYVEFQYLPHHHPLLSGSAPNLVRMILRTSWEPERTARRNISLALQEIHLLHSVHLLNDISSLPWNQLTSLVLRNTSFADVVPILEAATNLLSCNLTMRGTVGDGIHLRLPQLEMLSFHITYEGDSLEVGENMLGGEAVAIEQVKSLILRSDCPLERLRVVSRSSLRPAGEFIDAWRVALPLVDIDATNYWQFLEGWDLEKEEYWDPVAQSFSRYFDEELADRDSEED